MNCKECGIKIERKGTNQKYCKVCKKPKKKENDKRFYQKNKVYYQKQNKKYKEENSERLKEYKKEYNQRPEVKEWIKEYNQRPEVIKKRRIYYNKYKKEYNQRPEAKAQQKEYRQRPEVKKRLNIYLKKRKKQDIQFLLQCRLRRAVCDTLKNYTKTGKIMTSKKYGINYKAIIKYLKPLPKDIKNYEIDHIIPLSWFDLNNPEEMKWAFAPENHQWLTKEENIVKGNRMIYIKETINNGKL